MSKVKNGARYVRCPRCRQIIVEYNCVRIYQCQVCKTNLRAKYYGIDEGSSSLQSTKNTSGRHSFLPNELPFTRNEETDSSKQVESLDLSVPFALSSDDHKGKLIINDNEGDSGQVAFGSSASVMTFTRNERDDKAGSNADSLSSHDHKGKLVISNDEGDLEQVAFGSTDSVITFTRNERDDKAGSNVDSLKNAEAEVKKDFQVRRRGQEGENWGKRLQSSAETLGPNNSFRDEKVDTGNELRNSPKPTCRPSSEKTSSQDSIDTKTKKGEAKFSPRIQIPPRDLQMKAFHRPNSAERKRFIDDISIKSTKHQSHRPRDMSLDSEDFVKMRKWLEVEPSGPLKPPRNPKLHGEPRVPSATIEEIENVRVEIIKKVDNLRNEINDIFSEMKLGYGFSAKPNQGNYNNCSSGLMKHRSTSCREGRYSPHQCRLAKPPSYLHCSHNKPSKLPQGDTHHRSGRTTTQEPHGEAHRHENRQERMREKERMQNVKGLLRPVFGGAPFVTCSNCCKLLQIPEDLYITKKDVCKLQCSACSKVLVFSLSAGDCKISDSKRVATSTES